MASLTDGFSDGRLHQPLTYYALSGLGVWIMMAVGTGWLLTDGFTSRSYYALSGLGLWIMMADSTGWLSVRMTSDG